MIRKSKRCKYHCLKCNAPVGSYASTFCKSCLRRKRHLKSTIKDRSELYKKLREEGFTEKRQ